ncbi:HIT family protein [Flindersiella endophytica]
MPEISRESSCVFCGILAGDIPGTIVAETERAVAFMDISPATRGHTLVVPRAHTQDLTTIPGDDLAAVAELGREIAIRAKERLGADGVNLIQSNGSAAWQTVFHFHLHVVPRYTGDPLVLPWRPEPGNPEEIAEAAKVLGG